MKLKRNVVQVLNSLSLVVLLATSACSTLPEKYEQYDSGQWKIKALVKDKVRKKSYILYMDAYAEKTGNLRLDIENALGMHEASIMLSADQFQMLLVGKKRFYQGKNNENALRKFLPLNIKPELFVNMLFEVEPNGKTKWNCERGENHFLASCEHKDIKLSWSKRRSDSRMVQIDTSKASLQMVLDKFKPNVQFSADKFTMEAPTGFKNYKL